jgi:hypothetical protein
MGEGERRGRYAEVDEDTVGVLLNELSERGGVEFEDIRVVKVT